MRWLMIALLVSVAGLLFAAAGMARHIWLQRGRLRDQGAAGNLPGAPQAVDPVEDIELEP